MCTTELGYMAGLELEFAKRNCKIVGLSVDPVSSHSKWASDIEETQGHKIKYPFDATDGQAFVVGPEKKIKRMLSYPMSTGRNFDQVLRVLAPSVDSGELETRGGCDHQRQRFE